jgi:hypothetical protein
MDGSPIGNPSWIRDLPRQQASSRTGLTFCAGSAFNEGGVADDEEVIVFWVKSNLKGYKRLMSKFESRRSRRKYPAIRYLLSVPASRPIGFWPAAALSAREISRERDAKGAANRHILSPA